MKVGGRAGLGLLAWDLAARLHICDGSSCCSSSWTHLQGFLERYGSRLWRFRFDGVGDGVACRVVGGEVDDEKCQDLLRNMGHRRLHIFGDKS